ncbi:MAG: Kelch repeat-containing protein, partial [Myxococcaceae bacterium]|nr:Kelch repeat-containing protein [Myxococcaceae bacterium]
MPVGSAVRPWFTLLLGALLCACPSNVTRPEDAGTDAGAADGGGDRFAQSFTSREDFKTGTYNGVSDDVAGDLSMAIGQSAFATPYLWVPNATENSLSMIDTKTAALVGSYPLANPAGQPCYNPSRTTVDFNFDCWVGCRGFSSYLESYGGQPINEVDTKVMKVSFKDGKVLKSINVGHAPRALALDAKNHLWVGNSVDDTVWELDGDTGQCYRGDGPGCGSPSVKLGCDFPYGAVVDQKQMLWLACRGYAGQDGRVAKVDTATGTVVGLYGPFGTTVPSVFGAVRNCI